MKNVFFMVDLGHIPCRHVVKEYVGFFCILDAYLTRFTFLTILYSAGLCSNGVIHIQGSPEQVPYLVHNPITFHLIKGVP